MSNIIKSQDQQQNQLNHLRTLAKIASESKQYSNMSESQMLNLMLSAQDLGISPMKALNGGFYVVNGKVCMSTAMMADRIRKSGHSIKIIEMAKDKCVIIAKRKDNDDSMKLEYTWEDATLAGLTASPTWKRYPKNMLYNRCMSQIARILFPDVVGNSYSEEERFDIQGVSPKDRPLEDAEPEVTVDVSTQSEKINESQLDVVEGLLNELNDEKIEEFVCKRASIKSIMDLPTSKYDGVVKYLENQISIKQERETQTA